MDRHDARTAESAPADVAQACENLGNMYRRLYFMDKLNIIIKTDKQNGWGGNQIPMNDEQIKRHTELRAEDHAPLIEDWNTTAQQQSSSSGIRHSSASSSGHAALSAATARRTDAHSSEEESATPRVPDPLLPVTGTLIAAAPPAATAAAPATATSGDSTPSVASMAVPWWPVHASDQGVYHTHTPNSPTAGSAGLSTQELGRTSSENFSHARWHRPAWTQATNHAKSSENSH